jgi:hypothetical protein
VFVKVAARLCSGVEVHAGHEESSPDATLVEMRLKQGSHGPA